MIQGRFSPVVYQLPGSLLCMKSLCFVRLKTGPVYLGTFLEHEEDYMHYTKQERT